MRKKLVLILIITILINAIIPNFMYAVEGDPTEDVDADVDKAIEKFDGVSGEEIMEYQSETGKDMSEKITKEGEAPVTPSDGQTRTEKLGETATSSATVASVLCGFLSLPAQAVTGLMQLIVNTGQSEEVKSFTIEDLVFNKYELFNIDFFTSKTTDTKTTSTIKKSVAEWYYTLRNIAIVASVVILIYIGIRMAISTVATEQAKYKKMLMNWIISFVIVFTMHYIVIIMLSIQDWILEIVAKFVTEQGFEEKIIEDTWNSINSEKGWGCVAVTIQLYVIVFYQIKFFLAYFKRYLSAAFLFIISPLVTITYSIDAVDDGKAQAYNAWLKNITYNIFIQSIHAIVYAIFIISAAEIAKQVPIFGAILLMTLSRTEKVVKTTMKIGGKGIADEKVLDKIKNMGNKK